MYNLTIEKSMPKMARAFHPPAKPQTPRRVTLAEPHKCPMIDRGGGSNTFSRFCSEVRYIYMAGPKIFAEIII